MDHPARGDVSAYQRYFAGMDASMDQKAAFLAAHLLWFTGREELETLSDMVTTRAAQDMGVKEFGLRVGTPAHLVVLAQKNVVEALRYHEAPRHVISHGKLI